MHMHSYAQRMVSRTKDTHTINRVVRLGDEWDELGAVVGDRQRAATIRALVRWWLRHPDAKMPKRLTREEIEALLTKTETDD
jgi:hypothetical protein